MQFPTSVLYYSSKTTFNTGILLNYRLKESNLNKYIAFIGLILICYLSTSCNSPHQSEESPNYEIVFVSDQSRNKQIYLIDMDGSNLRRLTQDSLNYYYPQFSPDGSNQTNLTPESNHAYFSDFSPDGTKILFYDNFVIPYKYRIYIMDINRRNKIQLTEDSMYYHDMYAKFRSKI